MQVLVRKCSIFLAISMLYNYLKFIKYGGTSIMSRTEDVGKLIAIQQRRLQKLREQQAIFGINTPPHIAIEIEDLEEQITKLQSELDVPGHITSNPVLLERIRELEGPLATYNRRVEALEKDLARELDGERRAILEERLREVRLQRDKLLSEIKSIKQKLGQ